jgi:hypothetical protein
VECHNFQCAPRKAAWRNPRGLILRLLTL